MDYGILEIKLLPGWSPSNVLTELRSALAKAQPCKRALLTGPSATTCLARPCRVCSMTIAAFCVLTCTCRRTLTHWPLSPGKGLASTCIARG